MKGDSALNSFQKIFECSVRMLLPVMLLSIIIWHYGYHDASFIVWFGYSFSSVALGLIALFSVTRP